MMELIVAILFLAVVGAVVYKMMTKKETVGQAIDETIKEATPVVEQAAAKVEEEVKQVVEKVKKSRKKKAE